MQLGVVIVYNAVVISTIVVELLVDESYLVLQLVVVIYLGPRKG